MSESTTVRVHKSTRDLLRKAAEDEGITFDYLIQNALEARHWQRLKEQAAAQARRIASDPHEQALARQIADDFEEMSHNAPWPVTGHAPQATA